MKTSYRRVLLNSVNSLLGPAGLELRKKDDDFQDYIPLEKTLRDAEKVGMPVGDYIDLTFNVPGATQLTIDKMTEFGVFNKKVERVCEIGPGSGRYMEKVIKKCNPPHYEIYETSNAWSTWLVNTYRVVAQQTDGASLSATPSKSIDLVHTHKVLYGNSILTICRYFDEMIRVTKDGGFIVFDLMTEQCLTNEILKKWYASKADHAKSMTAKQYTIDFFESQGFCYAGGFLIPLEPAVTEYFVFNKQS